MFSTRFSIEWGDCDEAGIIYYPRYFDWFDRTFQRWLKAHGMTQRTLRAEFGIVGTALVEASARFEAPVTYGEEIDIEATVARWDERRFRIDYRILLAAQVAATGSERRAWVGRSADGRLKGLAIPQAFKDRLA